MRRGNRARTLFMLNPTMLVADRPLWFDTVNTTFASLEQSAGGRAMALRPLRDKVVVKPSDEEEKSAGGIFLPDSAKKKPQEGKVIAVGTGRVLDDGTIKALSVKVGDTV